MSGPPFTMSKYATELDLLRDKCAWQERKLAAPLADRPDGPEVAEIVAQLRDPMNADPAAWAAADALESLAAQLAERDAEIAKLKALVAAERKEHAKEIRDAIRDAAASASHAERYPDEPYGTY